MFVIAKYHDLLRRLGLDSLEGVKSFRGELIKDHKGRRDIQRIETTAGQQHLTFYLKRNWRPYKKDGLKSLFTRGEAWSQSRVEWENSNTLQQNGVAVAEPVAFGEQCGLLWERFSFLLTLAAPGTTVDRALRTCSDRRERRQLIHALGRYIRSMHDAGLASPDLFARHFFVDGGQLRLIDMARLDRRRRLPLRLRARDLAALNVSVPVRFAPMRERLTFLQAYGGDRRLRILIQRRTAYLLEHRRKFRDFNI